MNFVHRRLISSPLRRRIRTIYLLNWYYEFGEQPIRPVVQYATAYPLEHREANVGTLWGRRRILFSLARENGGFQCQGNRAEAGPYRLRSQIAGPVPRMRGEGGGRSFR
jgi:hypothetical protein